jgi:RimJ/RimL family protein N-acetyltransferase
MVIQQMKRILCLNRTGESLLYLYFGKASRKRMDGTKPTRLVSSRLELIAATLEHLLAELESPERLADLLDARVETGWPPGEYDRGAQEYFRDRLMDGGTAMVGWFGWYAIRIGNRNRPPTLIGAAGYLGPPGNAGEVEIGFSVIPAWQGRGYATEMVKALVENAFADMRVQKVIARTAPANPASGKVLEKNGFHDGGTDEDTGSHRFEILRNTDADLKSPSPAAITENPGESA